MTDGFWQPHSLQPLPRRPLGIWVLTICDALYAFMMMAPSMQVLTEKYEGVDWPLRARIIASVVVVICISICISSFGAWRGSTRARTALLALLTVFAFALVWESFAILMTFRRLGHGLNDMATWAWWDASIGIRGAIGLAVNFWYFLGSRPRNFYASRRGAA
jgi:hypothetical protein